MTEQYDELDPEGREAEQAEKRLLESMEEDALVANFRDLLQDERVRDLMWRILEKCHVYSSSYERNFGDMAHKEGERNIGLWLLKEICVSDPRAEMLMRQKSLAVAFAKAEAERIARQRPKPVRP